ncbi:hypothetical protein [Streptomyces sp. SID2888]|uniref:hypothetical protein n=1 Tax=Streptomyces sp. SID2888 TaxID=2690256 RepID=UPI0013715472|nr:hypothetical protein [Streptomyces sp. SID2888]MYV47973.1 hypothetical protein [Streptomyces sp. SID2888]
MRETVSVDTSEGVGRSAGPAGIRLGVVRGISYGMFGAPDSFVPEIRKLGAGLVRVYVYWSQVEPEPDRFDWTVVDAVLGQLDPAAETWVTVCSSSPWATRHPTDFLPSSPAKDLERYERFVREVVSRCRGRVDYWQCNNEPSNTGLLWAGTAPEYVDQLTVFHRVVRAFDPGAAVVLGGCGYDVLSSPPDSPARQFFDHLVEHGREAFDLFSVHLYGDPHAIPDQVAAVRGMMRRHGYERPVVAGEYNGPTLFEFPEAQGVFEQTMMAAFTGAGACSGSAGEAGAGTGGIAEAAAAADEEAVEPHDRRAMRALYARMPDLPPQLQMFLEGCPPELVAKRDRINQRQIVTRNVLAFASGLTRTACWNLAPEIPNYSDRFNLMGFLFGKLALMDYEGRQLTCRRPAADTFALLAERLHGATAIRRLDHDHDGRPLFAFEVVRDGREPLHVLWADGDVFTGEEQPPTPVDWPWPHATAQVVDAFGTHQPTEHDGVTVHLTLSVTPLFLSTDRQS